MWHPEAPQPGPDPRLGTHTGDAGTGLGVAAPRDGRRRAPGHHPGAHALALAGSLLGAWLGAHAAHGPAAPLTALAGSAVAANLALLVLDIRRDLAVSRSGPS